MTDLGVAGRACGQGLRGILGGYTLVTLFNYYMNLFGLGAPEIIVIVLVLLLFFGKDKLPGLAKSIGHSFNELKKGFSADTSDTGDKDSKKES